MKSTKEENSVMNEDQIKGNWRRLKGKLREKWGELIDDDIEVIEGRKEQTLGELQELCGIAREEAHKQNRGFSRCCKNTAKRHGNQGEL
jgi:uncharacterized protein YjbJ (UPF0337 family)